MALAIRGVNKFFLKFSISNYSLTTQIIIINLLTALIALVFLILFNYFLLSNSENLEIGECLFSLDDDDPKGIIASLKYYTY